MTTSAHPTSIYYFWYQIGNVIDNDIIMARLFIGTLKGVAFDWFRSMPSGSINSWVDLEAFSYVPRWHAIAHIALDILA